MNQHIAIIPARGGSKRIPKKNLINFHGKPMIAWTIEAALKSEIFERVMVSTDCSEIADVAISAGAEVPFLREENYGDFASVSAATISGLKQAEEYWDRSFDVIIQLMPNCPLRDYENIRSAVEYFDKSQIDYLISCFAYGWTNPWWAAKLDKNLVPEKIFPEAFYSRSQDLDRLFCPSGAIWAAKRCALLQAGTFYGPGHRFFPISQKAAIDIDDMEDYELALALGWLCDSG